MLNTAPEVAVACAVIRRGHQILLSQRLASAHQGGLWEFPGGKIDPSETAVEALQRELFEELGIQVLSQRYRFQIPWDYGDRRVRLWVFDVDRFRGEAVGLEGQQVAWVDLDRVDERAFPPANRAIVETLGLHRVARIYDPLCGDPERWIDAGSEPCLLYFRGLADLSQIPALAERAVRLGHQVVIPLSAWRYWQPGIGLHRRQFDSPELAIEARAQCPSAWPLTAGCRSIADWQAQNDWPAHAWFVSPVQATASHPGQTPLGWEVFLRIAQQLGRPCYALGGVTPADLPKAVASQGFGVAGIRGFQ